MAKAKAGTAGKGKSANPADGFTRTSGQVNMLKMGQLMNSAVKGKGKPTKKGS